jgi:hypothetical protein
MFGKIKDLWFLFWFYINMNQNSVINNLKYDLVFEEANKVKKNSYIDRVRRKMLYKIVCKVRDKFPFLPKDYTEARKLYFDYFQMLGHISSFQELVEKSKEENVYVVKFRDEIPVKGERYAEYHINLHYTKSEPCIFKLGELTHNFRSSGFKLLSPNLVYDFQQISDKEFTCFRYATLTEIQNFQKCEKLISELRFDLEEKEKEISEIKRKIFDLNKCKI